MKPSDYHKLSLAEKEKHARDQLRPHPESCPGCGAKVMPADLVNHKLTRCPGRGKPHPLDAWLSWGEAVKLVPDRTLRRWVKAGKVRCRGEGSRLYLHRDIALELAKKDPEKCGAKAAATGASAGDAATTGTERQTPAASDLTGGAISDPEPGMDTKQAAQEIGISPRTLRQLRAKGDGPRWYRVGRLVRYRASAVKEWLEQQEKREEGCSEME